ncbi:MAG: hypothetical protein ABI867_07775 [Kofleriaceae bacterium]
MVKLAVAAALLAGCFQDRYQCDSDADCDLGAGARCELDHFCTAFEPGCLTERSYSEHSGELANACFDDATAIANPCAAGQPPALREGCAATVCDVIPACCDVGWSDACVQQAQMRCGIQCDTRIAVTASRGGPLEEHWEFSWNGSTWTAVQRLDRANLIAWVAPPPGQLEPRAAGFSLDRRTLFIGDREIASIPERDFQSITSVDFDRNGHDMLALSYVLGGQFEQLIDLTTGKVREYETSVASRLTWGDTNRDGYPDGVASRNAAYSLLDNADDDFVHVRGIEISRSSTMGNANTSVASQLRELGWLDVVVESDPELDKRLDLVAFGNQVRIHASVDSLPNSPLLVLDCDPPVLAAMCTTDAETAFAGAPLPSKTVTEPAIILATFANPPGPTRHLYKTTLNPPTLTAGVTASTTQLLDACPTCPQIIAVITRDLDGDGLLDVIAIDERLGLHTATTTAGFVLQPEQIPPRPTTFTVISTSVTGAPIP